MTDVDDGVQMTVFQVAFDPDRTRIDLDGDSGVMGWGVQFPNGQVMVDWNRQAFAEDDRLDHPHISQYGSIHDVEQGTGGIVVTEGEHQFSRSWGSAEPDIDGLNPGGNADV